MTTSNNPGPALGPLAPWRTELIRLPAVRCPCCGAVVTTVPRPLSIEPCLVCRRPLALIPIMPWRHTYRLYNVLDLVGRFHGIGTLILVLGFAISNMTALAFAKAFTVLLFMIGSILITDGVIGLRTAIDRSWNFTRRGSSARLYAAGKIASGTAGLVLTTVGLCL